MLLETALIIAVAGLPAPCTTPVCKLDALYDTLTHTPRTRAKVEADEKLTMAYVNLEFAWAYARLGAVERSAGLTSAARAALPKDDGVHRWLLDAYVWRIANATAPLGEPLPAELDARLNSMERFDRYKVDRFRSQSLVLEGQERLEPISAFFRTAASTPASTHVARRCSTFAGKSPTNASNPRCSPPCRAASTRWCSAAQSS